MDKEGRKVSAQAEATIYNGTAVFPQEGGIEHLEAVYAWAHTLLAYTTTSCCVNTEKRGVLWPPPPFGGNTGTVHTIMGNNYYKPWGASVSGRVKLQQVQRKHSKC